MKTPKIVGKFRYKEDLLLEEASIKSSLLFNSKVRKKSRENYFPSFILSLLFDGRASSVDEIVAVYERDYDSVVDRQKIEMTISRLAGEGYLDINAGKICISKESEQKVEQTKTEIINRLEEIATEVLRKASKTSGVSVNLSNQIKTNIVKSIDYYFRTSCLSFMGVDYAKEVDDMTSLPEIISDQLSKSDSRITPHIIYELGVALEDERHADFWNDLAKIYIASQIVNNDPLLKSFKQSVIGSKVFVLDTDVIIDLLTKNTKQNSVYWQLLENLVTCGCLLYVPEEIITEVFHHAEAANTRYPFVSHLFESDDKTIPSMLKNAFVKDYYCYTKSKPKQPVKWESFIGNFYRKKTGLEFTKAVIKQTLGSKVIYDMPENGYRINPDNIFHRLYETVKSATEKTEKAEHRSERLNEEIAMTDSMLYLTVCKLNQMKKEQENWKENDRDMLGQKYYILTTSARVYFCAKELNSGIDAKVLCNPKALIAYLSEAGLAKTGNQQITNVFENLYLLQTAKLIYDDIKRLDTAGVDFSGVGLVQLRYDFQDELHGILTEDLNDTNMQRFMDTVHGKGYKMKGVVQQIVSQKESLSKEVAVLREEKKQWMEEKKRLQIIQAENQRLKGKLHYETLIGRIKPEQQKNLKNNRE